MRCHPNLTMRRWTESTKVAKRECAFFEPREKPETNERPTKAQKRVKGDDADAGTA